MSKKFAKLTDEELVRSYIESQQNCYFEEIYDRYSSKVYRKCYSFVSNSEKAEDFTHDIFFKLILKIGTFKESARFSTWLYSITYNHCMDQIRVSKKKKETVLSEGQDFVYEEDDAEFLTMQGQVLKKSLNAIASDEKVLILMKYQDNFSIKEISEALDISESAVKMRLLRSKMKLKKLYLENIALYILLITKFLTLWNK